MTVALAVPGSDPLAVDGLVHAAMARYDARYQGSVRLLSLSENATYAVRTAAGESFVLRLHRSGYHTPAAVRSELAWLAALAQVDVDVPRAVPGSDGELLQHACLQGRPVRMAVLFEWIEGQEPDPREDLQASFQRLGEISARLHRHARHWCVPCNFERPTWDHDTMLGDAAHWGRWRQAPHLPSEDCRLIEHAVVAIGHQLAAYGQGAERFGLIHADLRLANLLVEGDCTRVIDFDDCGFGWYLHDLASALSFHEHQMEVPAWIGHWLHGYGRVGSITQADLDVLPALLVQRRLQLLAWTGTHAETELARSLGPAWVAQTMPLCRSYLDGRLHFG